MVHLMLGIWLETSVEKPSLLCETGTLVTHKCKYGLPTKKGMSDTDLCDAEKTGLNVQEQEGELPRESKRLKIEEAVFVERMSGSLDAVFLEFYYILKY